MRNPRDFFKPLAIDAPEPVREIPFKPSRMIHFMDFSNPKMVEKTPDLAPQVDILLGNLEDAVPLEKKEAARAGLIKVGREMDLGETALWTRVNELASPYFLDDITQRCNDAVQRAVHVHEAFQQALNRLAVQLHLTPPPPRPYLN